MLIHLQSPQPRQSDDQRLTPILQNTPHVSLPVKAHLRIIEQRVRIVDPQLLERGIASVKLPRPESDFIFLNDIKESRFAHRNDFLSRNQWHRVADESILAFDRVSGAKGQRAARVRLLD